MLEIKLYIILVTETNSKGLIVGDNIMYTQLQYALVFLITIIPEGKPLKSRN